MEQALLVSRLAWASLAGCTDEFKLPNYDIENSPVAGIISCVTSAPCGRAALARAAGAGDIWFDI